MAPIKQLPPFLTALGLWKILRKFRASLAYRLAPRALHLSLRVDKGANSDVLVDRDIGHLVTFFKIFVRFTYSGVSNIVKLNT